MPPSAACASCPASPSAPTAASTGRATTPTTSPPGCGANPQHAATMEKGVGFQIADLAFPLNFPRSDYTRRRLPSAPETMDWMEEGVAWLAETFEIGGINIESRRLRRLRLRALRGPRGPTRRRPPDAVDAYGDSWSHTDMADNFPRLLPCGEGDQAGPLGVLRDAVGQPARSRGPPGAAAPASRRHLPAHHQSLVLEPDRARADPRVRRVAADPAQRAALPVRLPVERRRADRAVRSQRARCSPTWPGCALNVGMQGLTVWGEPSPYHATVELSLPCLRPLRLGSDAHLGALPGR